MGVIRVPCSGLENQTLIGHSGPYTTAQPLLTEYLGGEMDYMAQLRNQRSGIRNEQPLVSGKELPSSKPVLRGLFFDTSGRLWVELNVADGENRHAHVYDQTGQRVLPSNRCARRLKRLRVRRR
jgi:hypothetical protein